MKRWLAILMLLGVGILIAGQEWRSAEFIIADEHSGRTIRVPLSMHSTGGVSSISGVTGGIIYYSGGTATSLTMSPTTLCQGEHTCTTTTP